MLATVAPPPIPAYSRCMDATAWNALATARRLREAGFDRKQAETIADELRGAATADRDTLATRADIESTRADIQATKADIQATKAEIRATRADIEAAVAGLEARLYRALWVQGGGIVAIVAAFNLFA